MDEKAIIAICLIGIIALCVIAVVAINPPQSLNKSLNVYVVNLLDDQVLAWDSASGNWTNVNQTGGGSPGVNGTVWFTNSSAPSSGIGVDGDYFFNSLNGDVYQKVIGAWVLIGNLMGPTGATGAQGTQGIQGIQGATGATGATGANGSQGIQGIQGIQGDQGPAGVNGSTWHSGSGVPSSGLGTSGDYYLDTVSGNVYKKNGSWAVIGNIMGPQGAKGDKGDTGATGATGAQGIAGVNGTNGLNGTTLNQGLVGYWKFDENTGNIAIDNSGNQNSGTIIGATQINGKYGKALDFEGNDYVTISSSASLGVGNEGAISFWLKKSVWNVASEHAIINNDKFYMDNNTIYISIHGTVGLHFRYGGQFDVENRYLNYQGSDSWANGSEHFISAVWKRIDVTYLYLYADGALVDSDSTSLLISSASSAWDIGRKAIDASSWLYGVLDEVRIYNRALIQAEIENLYASNPLYYPVVSNSTFGFSVSTPTFPASGVDVINTNSYSVRIYILTIGTTTAYQITDQSGSAQSFSTVLMVGQEITLDSNAKIRFTYAVAPTWVWYGAG